MIVRFYNVPGERQFRVEYGWGGRREPLRGERIVADGTDVAFPVGTYRVRQAAWIVGQRGPERLNCWLETWPEHPEGTG